MAPAHEFPTDGEPPERKGPFEMEPSDPVDVRVSIFGVRTI